MGPAMECRTIFISDIHLGTRGCQAGMLLDFLSHHSAERIFLVGDIVDGWRLERTWHWPQTHNDLVQEILARARSGVEIVYIPGNHDEMLRAYLGTHFGGIEVKRQAVHVAADGRRYLITHGDQFDSIVMHAKWLAHLGDRAYGAALGLNTLLNRARRIWGGPYWSLSNWAKQQVKQAVNYISEYENVLAAEARRGGYDGIVCGHIHKAELSTVDGLAYVNCGDWVESCTAVIEHPDGRFELIDWAAEMRARALHRDRLRLLGGRRRGQDREAA